VVHTGRISTRAFLFHIIFAPAGSESIRGPRGGPENPESRAKNHHKPTVPSSAAIAPGSAPWSKCIPLRLTFTRLRPELRWSPPRRGPQRGYSPIAGEAGGRAPLRSTSNFLFFRLHLVSVPRPFKTPVSTVSRLRGPLSTGPLTAYGLGSLGNHGVDKRLRQSRGAVARKKVSRLPPSWRQLSVFPNPTRLHAAQARPHLFSPGPSPNVGRQFQAVQSSAWPTLRRSRAHIIEVCANLSVRALPPSRPRRSITEAVGVAGVPSRRWTYGHRFTTLVLDEDEGVSCPRPPPIGRSECGAGPGLGRLSDGENLRRATSYRPPTRPKVTCRTTPYGTTQ